jgi:hypothetical protein
MCMKGAPAPTLAMPGVSLLVLGCGSSKSTNFAASSTSPDAGIAGVTIDPSAAAGEAWVSRRSARDRHVPAARSRAQWQTFWTQSPSSRPPVGHCADIVHCTQ